MEVVTNLTIYFDGAEDEYTIPNTYEFEIPPVVTLDGSDSDREVELRYRDNGTLVSTDIYDSSDDKFIKFERWPKTDLIATVHATSNPYKTFAEFGIFVYCSDFCLECSALNTCDVCIEGYDLDIDLKCQPSNFGFPPEVAQGAVVASTYGIIIFSGL